MTEAQLKRMIQATIAESVQKTKVNFEACPQEMDAMEALEKVMAANFGDDFFQRLFRTARQFGIPNLDSKGIRGYVKAVSMPTDKAKNIGVSLEVENVFDNRMAIASLDGAAVNLYGSQLGLEGFMNLQDDGQGELDLEEISVDDDELDSVAE